VPGTSFDDVLIVNPPRIRPATSDVVAQAEAELGVRMPPGYAAFVERLGEGALGNFVRVFAPAKMPDLTRAWRERVKEYWFWDTHEAGVKPESLQDRGIVVADSFDGDELCFDPADPETFFVLPRHEDLARSVGPGFIAAVDWMLSGALNPWVEGWTFEAWTHRAELREKHRSRRLDEAARTVADLGGHSHMVDVDHRKTFFLPAIGGRLSLHQDEQGALDVDFAYDETADPEVVKTVLVAVRGNAVPVSERHG
jgi:hypothetical protein